MAKLYFRYGTVGSAKTMNLLAVAHNYQQQEKNVVIIKPKLDTRFGVENVRSRAGLERKADILVEDNTILQGTLFLETHCILVDEAQFLSTYLIDQLRKISIEMDIPVICYGLRTDFRSNLFDGSKRLFELCDSIEEIKNTCYYCNRKAIFNLKFLNGEPTLQGASIDLGAEEKYLPACSSCYSERLSL